MSNSEIMLKSGLILKPVLSPSQTCGRYFIHGKDRRGEYVACRLSNKNPSTFYGWYVLVSPEDLPLMENFNWYGHAPGKGGVGVRRHKTVNGKVCDVQLGRDIWCRLKSGEPKSLIYRLGHPMDYRRGQLSLSPRRPSERRLRGVSWIERDQRWHVQIRLAGKAHHIGYTLCREEGYRMYNRYLRELKRKFPANPYVQAKAYNEISPQF